MTVNRYLFQSPSASPVQVGRLDPSVKQDDTTSSGANTSTQLDTTSQKSQPTSPIQTQSVNSVEDVAPVMSDAPLLDVYA